MNFSKGVLMCVCGLFFLSGCSSPLQEQQPFEMVVLAEGRIDVSDADFFGSKIVLNDDTGRMLFVLEGDIRPLKSLHDQQVIVKGITSSSFSESPILNVFDVQVGSAEWKNTFFLEDSVSMLIPPHFSVDVSSEKNRVQDASGRVVFSLYTNTVSEWETRFIETGDLVFMGNVPFYRIISPSQVSLYHTDSNTRIDFVGDTSDLHLFYSILTSIAFHSSSTLLDTEKNIEEKNIEDNKGNDSLIEKESHTSQNNSFITEGLFSFLETSLLPSQIVSRVEIWEEYLLLELQSQQPSLEGKVIPSFTRTVFRVENENDEVILQKLSLWTWDGSEWRGEESGNVLWEKSDGFFPSHLLQEYTKSIPEGLIQYFSPQYHFSLWYPKQMYYTENSDGKKIFISRAPFVVTDESESFTPSEYDFLIQIDSGSLEKREDSVLDSTILLPKSEHSHFVLTTPDPDMFSDLQKLANSFILY